MADRKANLRLAYLAEDSLNYLPFDIFCRLLYDMEIIPIVRNDLYIGVFFRRGTELHMAILPTYRKRWVGKWFGVALKNLMVNGILTTTIPRDESLNTDFDVRRLGFKVVSTQGNTISLKMTMKDLINVWGELECQ